MRRPSKRPNHDEQQVLEQVQAVLLSPRNVPQVNQLLERFHYLGAPKPVGERLYYGLLDGQGEWLGVLVFCAAAKFLRHRDKWIGWTSEQRRRRLALVVNNTRFLLIAQRSVPNLGSRGLKLVLDRLSSDWMSQYGHPVVMVETFVDPEQFCGTVYTANGWKELGLTDGFGRHHQDYYVHHGKPKKLFVRELCKNGRRGLQAEQLQAGWVMVEKKVPPRCTFPVKQLNSLVGYLKQVPDFRGRIESYPVWSLLAIMACATLCDAPRGQKDLAAFSKKLSQGQRRALGIRRNGAGQYPAPSQPTFSRLLKAVDRVAVDQAVLAFHRQVRGDPPKEDLVVLDGKEPNHGGGHSILTAVTVPSQHYLGSAVVDQKTNEIPVARELFARLDLEGRIVSLDALHTQSQTARELVQEKGADYLMTVKENQPTLVQNIEKLLPEPPAAFPPCGLHQHSGL